MEIESKVKTLKEYKQLAGDLDAQITALEDEIKAEMEAQDTDTLITSLFKITWKKIISSRFDSSAFKKTHADLYEQYLRPQESRRFVVA
jgi:predicted phage-related endonuclease